MWLVVHLDQRTLIIQHELFAVHFICPLATHPAHAKLNQARGNYANAFQWGATTTVATVLATVLRRHHVRLRRYSYYHEVSDGHAPCVPCVGCRILLQSEGVDTFFPKQCTQASGGAKPYRTSAITNATLATFKAPTGLICPPPLRCFVLNGVHMRASLCTLRRPAADC